MNRVIIVTGAGSGIGRAVARAFLANGDRVALAGRRRAELEETAQSPSSSDQSLVAPTDLSDPDAVAALFHRVDEIFGRVDVLFNNAGRASPPVAFDEITLEDWRAVIDVNLTASFLCAQHAFRRMRTQSPPGGRIINNGSISAHSPRPRSAPYTASKHAITGLTRSLALDGRDFDIACSQIDIGNAETSMTSRMQNGVLQADGRISPEPVMDLKAVADAVMMMANMPAGANALFVTVMATKMPFVGRG